MVVVLLVSYLEDEERPSYLPMGVFKRYLAPKNKN